MSKEILSQPNKQLTAEQLHSPEMIERALTHFMSPDNPNLDINNFANSEFFILTGKLSETDLNKYERDMAAGLQQLIDKLEPARRFNETYIGHMLSQPSIPGIFGMEVAQIINSNTVASEVSRVETILEQEANNFILHDIIGYEDTEEIKASGTFTSGGSMANMAALTVARRLMPQRYPEFFEEKIINGVKKMVFMGQKMRVFVIPQKHYSIPKAIDLLGGPSFQIELLHINTENLRMSIQDLQEKINETKSEGIPIMAIVGIAGETETGIVDPLNEIADLAQKHGIFTIADGAFGASYRRSRNDGLFKGLNKFDAVIWDPHKTGYTPYGAGFVGFRNVLHHIELGRDIDAPYIHQKHEDDRKKETEKLLEAFLEPGSLEPESKRALGGKRLDGSMGAAPILSTLATKYTLGVEGLSVIYDITLDRIDHLYDVLKTSPYFIPVPDRGPDINLLCFRLKPEIQQRLGLVDKKHEQLIEFIKTSRFWLDHNIQGNGGYYLSDTVLKLDNYNPEDPTTILPVWRAVIMNPRTTDVIIDNAIKKLEKYIEQSLPVDGK